MNKNSVFDIEGKLRRKEMIESLLEALDYAVQSGDADDCARQVQIWANRVSSALAGAHMLDAYKAWDEALKVTYFSVGEYGPDYSFAAHTESLKAVLLGILANVEQQSEISEELFSMDVLKGVDRRYIQHVAIQANGCYKLGWYDACAVMIRRLVEILIVDCFEQWDIAANIKKTSTDEYYGFEKLIGLFLSEMTWHVPQLARRYLNDLKSLKEIGDSAAHGRNITSKTILDRFSKAIFFVLGALIDIAYFQRKD